jgi:hypothetical protein
MDACNALTAPSEGVRREHVDGVGVVSPRRDPSGRRVKKIMINDYRRGLKFEITGSRHHRWAEPHNRHH